jgi:hypothetical protein
MSRNTIIMLINKHFYKFIGSVVGWGTMLQAESRGFKSRWGGFFQFTSSFQPHYGPEVDSAYNRNEYQESSGEWRADKFIAICEPII